MIVLSNNFPIQVVLIFEQFKRHEISFFNARASNLVILLFLTGFFKLQRTYELVCANQALCVRCGKYYLIYIIHLRFCYFD